LQWKILHDTKRNPIKVSEKSKKQIEDEGAAKGTLHFKIEKPFYNARMCDK